MLTVLTRPVLISAHIVVLPIPRSLHAFLTVTASGFAPSRRSREMPVVQVLIRSTSHLRAELLRAARNKNDDRRCPPEKAGKGRKKGRKTIFQASVVAIRTLACGYDGELRFPIGKYYICLQ
jgi:hypothetical protein